MYRVGCTSDKIWNMPGLIRYLSTNQGKSITLQIDPEAVCLRTVGVYDLLDCFRFQSVKILTRNPFESHDLYTIVHGQFDMWFYHQPQISVDLQAWNGKRVFLCLYGRPTAGRLALAAWLGEKCPDISHIHFSTGIEPDDLEQFELDKLLSYDHNMIEPVGKMIGRLPLLMGTSERRTAFHGYDYGDPLTKLYQDILIDVIVESHVKGLTFFPTEKVIRAMWMKKPFVLFASRNFLDYLHQMGFRTFSDFWSEDYDGFEGRDRLVRICKLLDHLAALDKKSLMSMWLDMQYSLEHNFNLLKNKQYLSQVTQID